MQVSISGRHMNVTHAMREHARQRGERLAEHFIPVTRLQVTLDVDGKAHIVEMIASLSRGDPLVAHASTEDMYGAIDLAAEKLEHQLRRLKDRVRDHRRRQVPETATETGGAKDDESGFETTEEAP